MRFTKRQKEIIRKIGSREVWDIHSFVNAFQSRRIARYDWARVQQAFRADPEAADHYCAGNLIPTLSNLIPEDVFAERQRQGRVDPGRYVRLSARLDKTCSRQKESVLGSDFLFDFYQGVQVADSFDDLVEFLAIWQLLREHALVLEVPQPLSTETVGLFFVRETPSEAPPPEAGEGAETLCFSDRRYLTEGVYRLSEAHLEIFREFLGRRLYPAPGLKLFIQNRFRTQEEVSQTRSLAAAWAGIAVALLIGLAPYVLPAQASMPEASASQRAADETFIFEEDIAPFVSLGPSSPPSPSS